MINRENKNQIGLLYIAIFIPEVYSRSFKPEDKNAFKSPEPLLINKTKKINQTVDNRKQKIRNKQSFKIVF